MNELDRWLTGIRRRYSEQNEDSKRELVALVKSLDNYLATRPSDEKLRPIRVLIQKKMRKEADESIRANGHDMAEIQKLRNAIVHNRTIDNAALLSFGSQLWKEIASGYLGDVTALYNTLFYVIQPKNVPRLDHPPSAKNVVLYFKEIYESKNDAEKMAILRSLIPLITPSLNKDH
jgi:hypothetical protein